MSGVLAGAVAPLLDELTFTAGLPPAPTIELPKPERLVKLPRTGMRSHAARMLKEQGGLCPLCKLPIDLKIKGEGVIDHDHDDGRIRGLLHRSCNAAEGKIANAAGHWGAKSMAYPAIIAYLQNLLLYYQQPKSQFIYPMHKTKDEKAEARKKAARDKAAAVRARRALEASLRKQGTT